LINITLDLDEGAQFRVGTLTLIGPQPFTGAGKKMLEAWKSHESQIYSCDLGTNYSLQNLTAQRLRPVAMRR